MEKIRNIRRYDLWDILTETHLCMFVYLGFPRQWICIMNELGQVVLSFVTRNFSKTELPQWASQINLKWKNSSNFSSTVYLLTSTSFIFISLWRSRKVLSHNFTLFVESYLFPNFCSIPLEFFLSDRRKKGTSRNVVNRFTGQVHLIERLALRYKSISALNWTVTCATSKRCYASYNFFRYWALPFIYTHSASYCQYSNQIAIFHMLQYSVIEVIFVV